MTDSLVEQQLLRLEDVRKYFPVPGSSLLGLGHGKKYLKAVSGVSLSIMKGETLGLVGESGSGKSTTGRISIRLIEPTSGKIFYKGSDLSALKGKDLRRWRKNAQMIFQDPNASLPPRMTVGRAIGRATAIHLRSLTRKEQRTRVLEILEKVGLNPPQEYYNRYPWQLSGGERQRAVIARALVSQPEFVVADEPVAMLDVSVRAQIIELLRQLKENFGLTYLLITHDMSVAGYLCDKIAIMYLGEIVEIGTTEEIFRSPQHPYTFSLLSAIPVPDPDRRRTTPALQGEIPSPIDPPKGCHFHPRCKWAIESCRIQEPEFVVYSDTHSARCPVKPFQKRESTFPEPAR